MSLEDSDPVAFSDALEHYMECMMEYYEVDDMAAASFLKNHAYALEQRDTERGTNDE